MPGTRTGGQDVAGEVWGYAPAAVTAGAYLAERVILYPCRLTAVKAYANVAGTGGGSTVVDVLVNGVSVWSAPANRPTLAATAVGEFANTHPNRGTALDPGDRVAVQVAAVSTTGHGRVAVGAALEHP